MCSDAQWAKILCDSRAVAPSNGVPDYEAIVLARVDYFTRNNVVIEELSVHDAMENGNEGNDESLAEEVEDVEDDDLGEFEIRSPILERFFLVITLM